MAPGIDGDFRQSGRESGLVKMAQAGECRQALGLVPDRIDLLWIVDRNP